MGENSRIHIELHPTFYFIFVSCRRGGKKGRREGERGRAGFFAGKEYWEARFDGALKHECGRCHLPCALTLVAHASRNHRYQVNNLEAKIAAREGELRELRSLLTERDAAVAKLQQRNGKFGT